MIDFRYHLVSIIAVFLALAIGIVVGSTALKPAVLSGLNNASKQEKRDIDSLHAEVQDLRNQLGSDKAFVKADAARLLGHLLDGQRVVLVTAPGAESQVVSGVDTALSQAGARVTGRVALQQGFFDTGASAQSSLGDLTQQLAAAAGLAVGSQPALPGSGGQILGQQQAAELITAAVVSKDGPSLSAAESKAILSGFAQHGFVQVTPAKGSSALVPATLAVVVIPAVPPRSGDDSDPENLALLSVAQQLDTVGRGAVLAGSLPGSGVGSAINEVTSGATGVKLSTVDDANTEVGQVMVVQALSLRLSGHKPAAYGYLPDAAPSPAPTPSPSVSPSPSASPSASASIPGIKSAGSGKARP